MMKRLLAKLLVVFAVFVTCSVQAAKPGSDSGNDVISTSNGFPSGEHYNLIIHGKKQGVTCPGEKYEWLILTAPGLEGDQYLVDDVVEAELCPTDYTCLQGEQVFGNVVNVPLDGENINILMESGGKGPKSKVDLVSGLEVTDWCSGDFGPGKDEGDATFRLAANKDGYDVYARVHGKPSDASNLNIVGRELVQIGDNNGETYIILLGAVTEDGTFTAEACDDGTDDGVCTLERWSTEDTRGGSKGKAVKNATNITGLFSFSGEVCYLDNTDDNCVAADSCVENDYCCYVSGMTAEYYDIWQCALLSEPQFTNLDEEQQCTFVTDPEWFDQSLWCATFEQEWIFNIADMVDVLWGINVNQTYNLQVRFYPR